MVAGNGKKSKLNEEQQHPPADQIDVELQLSLEKLKDVQDELDKIHEEESDEVLAIEQKYNEVRRPIYLNRNELIKSMPDFWLTAFMSHPALGDLLTGDDDHEILKYVESLDVADFKDLKTGYSITFNFKENPYFHDTKLTKTYNFSDDGTTKITGTDIKWKEGRDPAKNGVDDEKKKGNKRPWTETSFFGWFGETEQDISELQDDVSEIIKEDLWPNPLKYFNMDADEEDSDEDEEESGDDGDEEDDAGEDGVKEE
ncbi:unnamed protein product [Linum tenue]|uniref:Uncharacterized protein n=1 Tax=Linum tenue TaxID=586396 RepID=A0AAV0N4F5_9ROSI|nr:unnamed protein product [Linum tenue]